MKTKSTFLARKRWRHRICCKAAPVATGRRSGLANARPWRQSHLNKPVIGWMPVNSVGRLVPSGRQNAGSLVSEQVVLLTCCDSGS